MTGGEIIAAGEAAGAIAKRALSEDVKTTDVLLRVGEDMPEMRSAARSRAARTAVKEQILLKLYWPFARLFNISQAYFEDTFPEEMHAKIADVPEENLITPSPTVAVPALEGLGYSFDEPSLKELYLNLLATASDDRRADQAHPAFADIIKQLAPDEAKLLNVVLQVPNRAIVRLTDKRDNSTGSYVVLMSHLIPLADATTGEARESTQAPTWIDNWQRLGLVNISYMEFLTAEGLYDWVEARPEYVRLAERSDIIRLEVDRGILRTTDFGRQFFRAVTE